MLSVSREIPLRDSGGGDITGQRQKYQSCPVKEQVDHKMRQRVFCCFGTFFQRGTRWGLLCRFYHHSTRGHQNGLRDHLLNPADDAEDRRTLVNVCWLVLCWCVLVCVTLTWGGTGCPDCRPRTHRPTSSPPPGCEAGDRSLEGQTERQTDRTFITDL